MQNRLDELETRLAFQDETLQILNTEVARQQQEIALLTQEIAALKAHLRSLAADLSAGRGQEPPAPALLMSLRSPMARFFCYL